MPAKLESFIPGLFRSVFFLISIVSPRSIAAGPGLVGEPLGFSRFAERTSHFGRPKLGTNTQPVDGTAVSGTIRRAAAARTADKAAR